MPVEVALELEALVARDVDGRRHLPAEARAVRDDLDVRQLAAEPDHRVAAVLGDAVEPRPLVELVVAELDGARGARPHDAGHEHAARGGSHVPVGDRPRCVAQAVDPPEAREAVVGADRAAAPARADQAPGEEDAGAEHGDREHGHAEGVAAGLGVVGDYRAHTAGEEEDAAERDREHGEDAQGDAAEHEQRRDQHGEARRELAAEAAEVVAVDAAGQRRRVQLRSAGRVRRHGSPVPRHPGRPSTVPRARAAAGRTDAPRSGGTGASPPVGRMTDAAPVT
ncbi:hypothetical protein [Clavibacter michiganensis]|uniref:hypothetical protein n=1 Tax=Clavibacter michiganensis TaxID=28447 RepID=UPI003EBB70FF